MKNKICTIISINTEKALIKFPPIFAKRSPESGHRENTL